MYIYAGGTKFAPLRWGTINHSLADTKYVIEYSVSPEKMVPPVVLIYRFQSHKKHAVCPEEVSLKDVSSQAVNITYNECFLQAYKPVSYFQEQIDYILVLASYLAKLVFFRLA